MSEDQKEETNGSEFSTRLRWGAATDAGRVRSANEDSWLIDFPLSRSLTAWAVTPPARSRRGSRSTRCAPRSPITSLESLVAAVKVANSAGFEMSRTDNAMRGMGTTLCAVALVDDREPRAARGRQRRRLTGLCAAGRRAHPSLRGPQPRREHGAPGHAHPRAGEGAPAAEHPHACARHRRRGRRRLVGGRAVLWRPLPALQ